MNNSVAKKFDSYPSKVKKKLLKLRKIILEVAAEHDDIANVEETLKWGEPSYLSKTGSTVRIDWKEAKPDQYAMYFHCQTKLVDTFKELYKDELRFEGNRAIVFGLDTKVPEDELKHCVFLALTYHRRKHLPMLGA